MNLFRGFFWVFFRFCSREREREREICWKIKSDNGFEWLVERVRLSTMCVVLFLSLLFWSPSLFRGIWNLWKEERPFLHPPIVHEPGRSSFWTGSGWDRKTARSQFIVVASVMPANRVRFRILLVMMPRNGPVLGEKHTSDVISFVIGKTFPLYWKVDFLSRTLQISMIKI